MRLHGLAYCYKGSGAFQGCSKHCLEVTLRLHEAAHDAEDGVQLLYTFRVQLGGGGGDDGVEGPLARRQAVGVFPVEDEIGAAILHGEQALSASEVLNVGFASDAKHVGYFGHT